MSDRPGWKIGDTHYAIFLRDQTYHEPRRTGVVVSVGRDGFRVKLDKPDWEGKRFQEWPFHATPQFNSLGAAEAWCRENPQPDVGRAERAAAPAQVTRDEDDA